jgi:hypothetical protein
MYYMSETHEKDNYFELVCVFVCVRAAVWEEAMGISVSFNGCMPL